MEKPTPAGSPPTHRVGVDLGGNRILVGLFDEGLRLEEVAKRSTKSGRGPDEVVSRIERCVRDVLDEADLTLDRVRSVGIGVPGSVEASTGVVRGAPRLGWTGFPLGERLRAGLGVPVFVEHDGQLAALAVHARELEGRPARLLAIFIGERIGGGWVVNGRTCAGFGEATGDLGHLVLQPQGPPCRCGNRGCFESFASRAAVLERIQGAVREGRRTVLSRGLEEADRLRGKDLRRAFRRGDAVVREAVESAANWMGVALGSLIQTLQPDVVALGGSLIAHLGEDLLPSVLEAARKQAPDGALDRVIVHPSTLGDEACLIGAALLARERDA